MKVAKGLRARQCELSLSLSALKVALAARAADREMMVCVNKEQGDSHAARVQTCVTNSFI